MNVLYNEAKMTADPEPLAPEKWSPGDYFDFDLDCDPYLLYVELLQAKKSAVGGACNCSFCSTYNRE